MHRAAVTPPRLATLILLSGLSVLSLNMFVPSLPNMAADFRVDYSLASLSISGYLAVTAALQGVIGPLSDRFGRRPVLLASLALFTVASLVCTVSTDFRLFLACRVLQGAIISGWAVSIAVIRDMVPQQEAASRIGYVSMGMAVAPMAGPLLGGVLDELAGWRASFATYSVLGALMLALCWIDVGETTRGHARTLRRQVRDAVLLLRSGRFQGYTLCMAFSTGAFYAFLAGAPLVASATFGMPPGLLGVCLGSITAGFMLGSFLSGRFARFHALTTMMIAGRLVAVAGLTAGLALLAAGLTHPVPYFGATIFAGIGNGLTMPGSNAGALSVRPRLAGSAAGLSGALTIAGGAAVSSITGALLTENNASWVLLVIMLAASFAALIAAFSVHRMDGGRG